MYQIVQVAALKLRVEAVVCDGAFWTLGRLDQNHSLQV
jgi:hypothetical protein